MWKSAKTKRIQDLGKLNHIDPLDETGSRSQFNSPYQEERRAEASQESKVDEQVATVREGLPE